MIQDAEIKAALKNVETEVVLRESEGRGGGTLALVVRRLADGGTSAQWFAMSKRGGKRTKRALGRFPDLTLRAARLKMREAVAPVLRAGKPLRAAKVGDGKPTIERMFEGYVASMRAAGRASADEVERMLLKSSSCAAAFLGRDRLAADVGAEDAVEWIATFYRSGRRGAADKARAYLSAAFGWAAKSALDYTRADPTDWGVRANPVTAIPKDAGARKARDRNLSPGELAALWRAAEAGDGFGMEVGACVRLLIACGQRVQETLRIEGSEVDLDAATWSMPAHKTKGGRRPHTIPLPPQAVDILRQLKARNGDGPLFPARTGAKGELAAHRSVRQAIDRWTARDDVNVAPFQPRDLRRTWKSRAGDAGIDRFMRDLIQQHAQDSDTGSKHYDRHDYLPAMREAMARWGEWLSKALEQSEQSIRRWARAA